MKPCSLTAQLGGVPRESLAQLLSLPLLFPESQTLQRAPCWKRCRKMQTLLTSQLCPVSSYSIPRSIIHDLLFIGIAWFTLSTLYRQETQPHFCITPSFCTCTSISFSKIFYACYASWSQPPSRHSSTQTLRHPITNTSSSTSSFSSSSLKLTESNCHCSFTYGYMVVYWNMSNLSWSLPWRAVTRPPLTATNCQ